MYTDTSVNSIISFYRFDVVTTPFVFQLLNKAESLHTNSSKENELPKQTKNYLMYTQGNITKQTAL